MVIFLILFYTFPKDFNRFGVQSIEILRKSIKHRLESSKYLGKNIKHILNHFEPKFQEFWSIFKISRNFDCFWTQSWNSGEIRRNPAKFSSKNMRFEPVLSKIWQNLERSEIPEILENLRKSGHIRENLANAAKIWRGRCVISYWFNHRPH